MIARDITGNTIGGANQLFDLLSFVSDPQAYAEKVKELQALIQENKRYAEAVAQVNEILEVRKRADADAAEAKTLRDRAANEYDAAVDAAAKRASEITSHANNQASILIADAKKIKDEAATLAVASDKRTKSLDAREAELNKLSTKLAAKQSELDAALLDARNAKEEAVKLKETFLAKQKAFLESI